MKRTKQWWSNLTEGERSELTLLEREEKQEDRSDTYIWEELDNWCERPDNWCEPDILCGTECKDDDRRYHISNLKRITEIIEKADDMYER